MENRAWRRYALCCAAAILLICPFIALPTGDALERVLVNGNAGFAFELFREARGEPGNLFLSPYSLSSALAMTWGGARGTTAAAMAKVLQLPTGQSTEAVHGAFAALQRRLSVKTPGWEIAVANRLFGQAGEPFRPEFLGQLTDWYDAPLEAVDFFHQTEAARAAVNRWVEAQTRNKVSNLFPMGSIRSNTRLVLANAIWFKGQWSDRFDPEATREEPFHISPQQDIKVAMMHRKAMLAFYKNDEIALVQIPYEGGELAMVIVLPNDHVTLSFVEQNLGYRKFEQWIERLRPANVRLRLPRFTMTWAKELSKTLGNMGMRDAFSPTANFSGMTRAPGLFLSQVRHKAFVEVNEEGTEAAGATGVTAIRSMSVADTEEFSADHPFIFVIREVRNGAILFIGRLADPSRTE